MTKPSHPPGKTISKAPRRPARTDAVRLPFRWAGASRSREGELYRRVVRQLRDHIGGRPSAAEEMLIGRIAFVQVHLAHIDERALQDGGLSPHATREYLAWSNTVAKLLRSLGLKGAAQKPPTVQEIVARRQAARG
jgi:hypothetical protein